MSAGNLNEPNRVLRVLNDPPCGGVVNMARDEALLTLVGQRAVGPTLRMYQWSEPTISLGYFQRFDEYKRLPAPAGDLPVVRRTTGGGAILHDLELTYALVIPADHPMLARPARLYEIAHHALIESLLAMGLRAATSDVDDGSGPNRGPFFCFARRHPLDVVVGDKKLAGSAQRRTGRAVLQHGSIMIGRRYDQQPSASAADAGIGVDQLGPSFSAGIARALEFQCETVAWSHEALEIADGLVEKYAGTAWTQRR